jgi:integrase
MRYSNQVLGINKLKTIIKIVCQRAGLQGNFSTHSGKKTCAKQLYTAGIDEQDIMARTGHRSEKPVRKQ